MSALVVSPTDHRTFVFVRDRLWLDFVNTDDIERGVRRDALREFGTMLEWLAVVGVIDHDRRVAIERRAERQPSDASAALLDARRVRSALSLDSTKNGSRRWCDMATGSNRAKAARHRAREPMRTAQPLPNFRPFTAS